MMHAIQLSRATSLEERPFTDVVHNDHDLAAMRRILSSLLLVVGRPLDWPTPPQPLVVRSDENGRLVRVVVCNRPALMTEEARFVVGFFGQRRPERDATLVNAVDDDLIHEFPQYPGVLSYSSFELEDGNYVNVVMLEGAEAKEHWRASPRHAYAARDLAPEFYRCIRLQNAVLPRGLASLEDLRLIATKYFDYQHDEPWMAVRTLEREETDGTAG